MPIGFLVIGDEILSGDRYDVNASFFIELLKERQSSLDILLFVKDSTSDVVNAFLFLSKQCNFIVTLGGLGLTPDDITLYALSKAINLKLVKSNEKEIVIRNNVRNYPHSKYNDYIERLSYGIENSKPISNSVGIAAGEHFLFNNCNVFVLPGVPDEFQHMLKEYVIPNLPKETPNQKLLILQMQQKHR
jgi:nicotinamide-nucleotide amidase